MGVRVAVLASGNGSNLHAILEAVAAGRLDAEVVGVFSNRPAAHCLTRATAAGVAATAIPVEPGEARGDYDARLAGVVAGAQPDLVVLAGWMRLLSMGFLARFPHRVVNLHPARPGELPGTHAIERAFDESRTGSRTSTGVMVHLVPDEGVDDGPVLASVDVPIEPTDTLDDLTRRVHAAEHELLVSTLIALSTARSVPTPPVPTSPLETLPA